MAVTLLESFDGWATPQQMMSGHTTASGDRGKWVGTDSVAYTEWEFAAGRTANCLRKSVSGSKNFRTFLNFGTEIYFGFGYNPAALGTARTLVTIYDTGETGGANHCVLDTNAAGNLVAKRGGTTLFTTSVTLTAGAWQYIEVYFKCADSGGRYEIKWNGVLVGSFTGDTREGSVGNLLYFHLTRGTTGVGDSFDDIYIINPLTAGANSYLGDTKIHCIRPNGNGTNSDWLGSDGNSTDNYLLVDEQSVNDADYVESDADADRDLYAFENPTIAGSVAAVQLVARGARLSEADPKSVNLVAKVAADVSAAAPTTPSTLLTASLKEVWRVMETDPAGGAWSPTDVNDAEFGYDQVDA